MECMKSELDIFHSPAVQTSILKTEEVAYNPIASLENSSTIEFVSLGHGDTYRDLSSTYLKLKLQILKKDGHAWNDDKDSSTPPKLISQPGIVNNLLHSLIKQCSVQLNGKNVTTSDNNYNYKAYIETLFNYGNDAVNTHLQCVGWHLDTPGIGNWTNTGNSKRKEAYNNSGVVELMGKLHVDIFNQPTLLINNVDVKVLLTLDKPDFYFFSEDSDESQLKILEATLFMKHVTINPSILLAHNTVLQRANAKYHYKRVEIKTFTIPDKSLNVSLDNVFMGQLPNRIIFCMVENEAFNGKRSKNPFNFRHYFMTQFVLYVNGTQVPNLPIETNFTEKTFLDTRAYHSLFSGTGIHHDNIGHQITKSMFSNGFYFLAFDLSPDLAGDNACQSLLNQGSVRIEAKFAKNFGTTITCMVYGEFDATLEIDKNRNVYVNV